MSEDTSSSCGKVVVLFEEEIAETTKIGLRTVLHMIKNWENYGEPSSMTDKICLK